MGANALVIYMNNRSKITMSMNIQDVMVIMCEKNPGALSVLVQMAEQDIIGAATRTIVMKSLMNSKRTSRHEILK